jgi:hypothetical protein
MKVVDVDLGDRSYPIYIGQGLLDQGELLRRHIPGKRVLVVTNETVAPLYLERRAGMRALARGGGRGTASLARRAWHARSSEGTRAARRRLGVAGPRRQRSVARAGARLVAAQGRALTPWKQGDDGGAASCGRAGRKLPRGASHARTHARARVRVRTRTHTHTHTHAHAHAHAHTRTRTRTHAHTHTHTPAHAHAHAHTRTRTRTHAHTHTHTHTHTHARTRTSRARHRCKRALEEGGLAVDAVVLPDGEEHKTMEALGAVWDAALERRLDRGATFLALGGGVVGDMCGFAAACYQRGVHFVQVPTTVMAQVDSSVGGKTGVNHPLGKNMIGAFYQPLVVLVDTDTLATLPDRRGAGGARRGRGRRAAGRAFGGPARGRGGGRAGGVAGAGASGRAAPSPAASARSRRRNAARTERGSRLHRTPNPHANTRPARTSQLALACTHTLACAHTPRTHTYHKHT